MKTLSETWFADGYIDFELKKYTLLAYLQEINKCFKEIKLYPQLSDVIFHYNNIVSFQKNKKILQNRFSKKLTLIQIQKLQLLYQQMVEDDDMMKELEDIILYAEKEMHSTISNGTKIYEFIEDQMQINPIGIIPLKQDEGYFFLTENVRQTHVYYFQLSIFENKDEKYQSIKTQFIQSWYRNFVNTYESIKRELIKSKTNIPNPAVYSIETELNFPVEETLLPIAKRSLVRYISNQ